MALTASRKTAEKNLTVRRKNWQIPLVVEKLTVKIVLPFRTSLDRPSAVECPAFQPLALKAITHRDPHKTTYIANGWNSEETVG